jgi:hypothetical protein
MLMDQLTMGCSDEHTTVVPPTAMAAAGCCDNSSMASKWHNLAWRCAGHCLACWHGMQCVGPVVLQVVNGVYLIQVLLLCFSPLACNHVMLHGREPREHFSAF